MKQQYKFLVGGVVIFVTLVLLSVQGLQEMTVFFYTPNEIISDRKGFEGKLIRIGALVQKETVRWNEETLKLSFEITEDSLVTIPVSYQGTKPDMFKEGQGVVVEGRLRSGVFEADLLLVKHSEDYEIDSKFHQDKKQVYSQSLIQ